MKRWVSDFFSRTINLQNTAENRVQRENSVEKWTRICPYANIDLENLRGSKEEATNSFLSLKKYTAFLVIL